jgi:uncharacterized protein YcfJ
MRSSALPIVSLGAIALGLTGCVSTPPPPPPQAEPQVQVMPPRGKPFAKFQREDEYCQAQAQQAVGYRSPEQAQTNQTVGGAVVGTLVGAAAGAAIGAAAGNAGAGAAIGAGTGLVGGTAIGAAQGGAAADQIQGRYDTVYAQCMTSKGNMVMGPEAPPPVIVASAPPPVYFYPRPYTWGPGVVYGPRPYRRWY